MDKISLKVGRRYLRNDDTLVTISKNISKGTVLYNLGYRYMSDDGHWYTEDGNFFVNESDHVPESLELNIKTEVKDITPVHKTFVRKIFDILQEIFG